MLASEYNSVVDAPPYMLAHAHFGFWVASGTPSMRTFRRAGIIADNATDYEGIEVNDDNGGPEFDHRKEQSFGSPHPGTCNFVLGDGSTHAVSQTTRFDALNQFGMRADGAVIDVTEL